ncbi:hypothetical protein [Reichenbachiella ulvae]|uniref:DUF4142 domain-containing protein n=1 Tax=Reichenbachiella ulvae TaxID=2980104 RepID=A0ABT3CQW6_9BACT|nr:hypothetical protein [Reichenbachiella ulvae]MCV9386052.1 hypothetical protein [Reichenbachiella ulvae]
MNRIYLVPLLFVLVFSSCSKADRYRTQIEEIGDKWETLASDATNLSINTSENIKTWQTNYQNLFSSFDSEEISMSEEEKSKLDQFKITCLGHGDVYVEIQEVMDSRIKEIEAKGIEIQELMLALEGDAIPDDIDSQIKGLTDFIDSTEVSIHEYEQITSNTQKECISNCMPLVEKLKRATQ